MDTIESLYSRLGGVRGLREFVDNLYNFMDDFPAVEEVREMHPDDLAESRDQLFILLSAMLGGPTVYLDEFQLPYLGQEYLYFDMTDLERDQWLFCAQNAVNQLKVDSLVREELMSELTLMVTQVVNHHLPTAGYLFNQNTSIH